MATAPVKRDLPGSGGGSTSAASVLRSAGTRNLKAVPPERRARDEIRAKAVQAAATIDKSFPLTKRQAATCALDILRQLELPECYLGWTMVAVTSAFWRDQLVHVPIERRLLLLPPIIGHVADCDGDARADHAGAVCAACGLDRAAALARRLGYQVVQANGSDAIMKSIVTGEVDALIGVASLGLLEKAIDRIFLASIPCQALPLLAENPSEATVDADWLTEIIETPCRPGHVATRTYTHLMRSAARMFTGDELARLAPRLHANGARRPNPAQATVDPIAATENIAYDFLGKGGKHSRPFITLAVHDSLTGGQGTQANGAAHLAGLPTAIFRAALSIETFHKASLVHDDIEDDDQYRYGDPTLHRTYGTATAINVGDYLIGLGYRLVSRETSALGPEVVADILDRLAQAHMKLAEGQGAELLWRDSGDKSLTPQDALDIYALKTSPAFEAALYAGMRLACPIDGYQAPVSQFARHLGVAFQILNDLNDWNGDTHNKLLAAGDVVGGRPTLLWALALERLAPEDRAELKRLAATEPKTAPILARIKQLYQQARVFDEARALVEEFERKASAVAEALEPEPLRRLLGYLIQMVLDRQS